MLVFLGDQIDIETHHRVVKLLRLIETEPVPGILNLHPAYSSLLVKFDSLKLGHDELEAILRTRLEQLEHVPTREPRHVEIPVCYGGEFGPDLDEVSALHEMTPAQVTELQASAIYVVYFLGFVPGFAYLGGLPEVLATPRKTAPRKKVPAGSLGIAGNQAGVYPVSTPGGWNLIGRTPVSIFRPDRSDMSLLSIGDRVRFTPISEERFAAWL